MRRFHFFMVMGFVFGLFGGAEASDYYENLTSTKKVSVEHLNNMSSVVHHDNAVDHFETGASRRLTEYLLGAHNRHAPPDGVVDIHYEMELVHILGIDELKQTMTALVYVTEIWNDPSLAWNESEFGHLTKTWLPMHKIWRPDLIVFNMISSSRLHHEDLLSSVRAPVTVFSNGTVECSSPSVYTVSCHINIKMFPLDTQQCALEIASWAYSDEKIRLHSDTEHSLDHYAPNEEWHLIGVDVREREYIHEGIPVSEIHYEISVKRKPLFYMVTLTFPSYLMCFVSIVGLFARFSTTGEREERFTLGVSGILTMAVLSLVVSEKVPHSSTSVPLLVAYFLYNMVVVSVASVTTGLVMKVHRLGRFGDEPSEFWIRMFCVRPHYPLTKDEKKSIKLLASPIKEKPRTTLLPLSNGDVMNGFSHKPHKLSNHISHGMDFAEKLPFTVDDAENEEALHALKTALQDKENHFKQQKMFSRVEKKFSKISFNNLPANDNLSPETQKKLQMASRSLHEKLDDLEFMLAVILEQNGLDDRRTFEKQYETRRRRQENNGYVQISERLDTILMTFFLSAVTIPVVYLFVCMFQVQIDNS